MSGQPWSSYEFEDLRSFQPTEDTAVVTYGVLAQRDKQDYSALMSSVYVRRDGEWRLTISRHRANHRERRRVVSALTVLCRGG
jgi:hypothetical protein